MTQNEYWTGFKNRIIRYHFYIQKGLDLFNSFRYLGLTIIGIYFALKVDNPSLLIIMFAVAIPLLMLVGWASVHHIGKVVDYLNVRFSSHYTIKTFELLTEILEEIKKVNNGRHDKKRIL